MIAASVARRPVAGLLLLVAAACAIIRRVRTSGVTAIATTIASETMTVSDVTATGTGAAARILGTFSPFLPGSRRLAKKCVIQLTCDVVATGIGT